MGQAIPRQNPAVVLRSHYRQLRALLALALVIVVGLSVALVIVATDDESITTSSAQPVQFDQVNPQAGRMGNVATLDAATAEVATPDESKIAAAISSSVEPAQSTPDESKIAAAISPAQQAGHQSGPDESSVAAAIGNSTASPSTSRSHPGARP